MREAILLSGYFVERLFCCAASITSRAEPRLLAKLSRSICRDWQALDNLDQLLLFLALPKL